MIHIWYHAEGVEPTWQLPEIEQITSHHWTYRGRTEHHVNAHIEVTSRVCACMEVRKLLCFNAKALQRHIES